MKISGKDLQSKKEGRRYQTNLQKGFSAIAVREQAKKVIGEHKEEVIDTMAEMLGISHIMQQKAGICSYGEQQRIAIIRALVQPFKWLLMDEPFSHLDEANTLKAAKLIAEECTKRNAGFILTDLEDDSHFDYSRKMSL